jgi:hypothetical protein
MTRTGITARHAWHRIRGWLRWLRHGQEEIEALYGPNPNGISPEEKIAQVGTRLSGFGGRGPSTGF